MSNSCECYLGLLNIYTNLNNLQPMNVCTVEKSRIVKMTTEIRHPIPKEVPLLYGSLFDK